jgi:hypothetical protein
VQDVLDSSAQPLDQLLRALERVASEVDDDLRLQRRHPLAKAALALLRRAIERLVLHLGPCAVPPIGLALAAANDNDVVPRVEKPRHQV